jgi:hypothetical protein
LAAARNAARDARDAAGAAQSKQFEKMCEALAPNRKQRRGV